MQEDAEVWVIIHEFPNYEVSTHGRIRNIETQRILKPHYNQKLRPMVHLRKRDKYGPSVEYTRQVNSIVGEAFLFYPFEKMKGYVTHRDGDYDNCRVDNLFYATLRKTTAHHFKMRGVKP